MLVHARGNALHGFVDYGALDVEHFDALLREVADAHIVPHFAHAVLDFDTPGEDLKQRGFTCAIGADQHDALLFLNDEIQVGIDDVVAVGLLDIFKGSDALTAAHWLREAK